MSQNFRCSVIGVAVLFASPAVGQETTELVNLDTNCNQLSANSGLAMTPDGRIIVFESGVRYRATGVTKPIALNTQGAPVIGNGANSRASS